MVVVFFNYLWIGPIQTMVVTYFLWQEIGVSSIIGVALLLVTIPIQGLRYNFFNTITNYKFKIILII